MNKYKKIIAIFLSGSLLFTGCSMPGKKENNNVENLMNYQVSSSADIIKANTQEDDSASSVSLDYLSDGISVIPKNQVKKKGMDATSTLLINDTTGQCLYAQNIYKKIYPASITKIVTALVALKYGNLDDTVTIGYNATHINEWDAKLCGFQEGDQISLRKLLTSFLVCSGNDAGVAIAEHIAGSVPKFAKLMNKEVQELGATHSHFVNPHGLHDENHYTTAYDLYLIFHELEKYPTFFNIVNHGYYVAHFKGKNGKKKKLWFRSTDRYLIGRAEEPKGITVIGGKTGTTFMAGSCLILLSKDKHGNKFVSVVLHALGGEALYQQMNHLLSIAAKSTKNDTQKTQKE